MSANGAANSRFSRLVRSRDGYRCRMERWVDGKWYECLSDSPLTAAHIYGRADCGESKHCEEVGITACVPCHDRYDLRTFKGAPVRVPPEREQAAYDFIMSKRRKQHEIPTFEVVRRLPPERPDET